MGCIKLKNEGITPHTLHYKRVNDIKIYRINKCTPLRSDKLPSVQTSSLLKTSRMISFGSYTSQNTMKLLFGVIFVVGWFYYLKPIISNLTSYCLIR